MFETCYILKNSWMHIFQITLLQFVFKTVQISLVVDTCNQCDTESKTVGVVEIVSNTII